MERALGKQVQKSHSDPVALQENDREKLDLETGDTYVDLYSDPATQTSICSGGLMKQVRTVHCEVSTGKNQGTRSKRRYWCLGVVIKDGIGGANIIRTPLSHQQGCEGSLEIKYGKGQKNLDGIADFNRYCE